jgi:hypothetical protein
VVKGRTAKVDVVVGFDSTRKSHAAVNNGKLLNKFNEAWVSGRVKSHDSSLALKPCQTWVAQWLRLAFIHAHRHS